MASAQLKSCVLLAGLFADGKTSIIEETPTRDHTERMLRFLGIDVESVTSAEGEILSVPGEAKLIARDINVPGDISAAAFFIVAASCLEDSEAVLKNVGLNPSRTAVLEALRNFGAEIEILNKREVCNEPVGDLVVRKTRPRPQAILEHFKRSGDRKSDR